MLAVVYLLNDLISGDWPASSEPSVLLTWPRLAVAPVLAHHRVHLEDNLVKYEDKLGHIMIIKRVIIEFEDKHCNS